jgi:hypothetical protein
VCNSSEIVPQITIKNYGTNAFSTVTVNYELNGGAPVSVPFNALVASGQTANFTLPTIVVGNGVNTLLVYTSDPDGQADGNPANDERQTTFNVSNPGEVVTLQIKLDDYGSETTWELTPQGGGAVIAQGGPYSDNQDGVVIGTEFCLSNGCYVVTLDDAYGDGICCGQYGDGDFWVLNSLGDTLVNGNGDFNTTTSVTFCLENVGVDERDAVQGLNIWPNPGTGLFELQFLRPSAQVVRLDVRDALGRLVAQRSVNGGLVRTTLDLSALAEGSYALEAISGNDRTVRRLVISR